MEREAVASRQRSLVAYGKRGDGGIRGKRSVGIVFMILFAISIVPLSPPPRPVANGLAGLRRGILRPCPEGLAQQAPPPLRRLHPEGSGWLLPTPGAAMAREDRSYGGGGGEELPGR